MILTMISTIIVILISMYLWNKLMNNDSNKKKTGISEGEKALLDALHNNELDKFIDIYTTNKFSPNFITYVIDFKP